MPAKARRATAMIAPMSLLTLLLTSYPSGPEAASCPPGSTARFTIINKCADKLWTVVTAPGNPAQIAVAAQWNWVNQYVTHQKSIDTGGTGSIGLTTPTTLTITKAPNPAFVAGMKIRITGAGDQGADLTTTIAAVSSGSITLADAAGTAVTNAELWLYDGQGAFAVPAGTPQTLCVPDKGAPGGNFRFFMGCPSFDSDDDPFNVDKGGCIIGSSFGDLAGINTLFEPSFGCVPPLGGSQCAFNPADGSDQGKPNCPGDPNSANCGPLSATDFYDISAVDGYTMPMRVDAAGAHCSAASKDASMLDLASCPTETAGTLYSTNSAQQALIEQAPGISLLTQDSTYLRSCAAPYKWFASTALGSPVNPTLTIPNCSGGTCNSVSYYAGAACDNSGPEKSCPGGSGPQQRVGPAGVGTLAIQNTGFVQHLHAMGYTGYTWQYDDGIGGQACDAGSQITVTLCPSGSSRKPYQKNQLWTFSASSGTCGPNGTSGTPDGTTTFGSLFDCQTATMRYRCHDLTASDPFNIPTVLWEADPAATVSGAGSTYAEVQALRTLKCDTYSRVFPEGGGEGFNGGGKTTVLGSGLDNTQDPVTFTVQDGETFPTSGSFDIQVDSEVLKVTAVTGNSFTAARAQAKTSAAPHADGAQVLRALELPICNYVYAAPPDLCPKQAVGGSTSAGGFTSASALVAFQGSGKAQNVGVGKDSGNIRISGRFTAPFSIPLDQSTLLLTHVLDEKGAIGDLTRGAGGVSLLPVALLPRSGSKPNGAIYQTPSGARPSVRMEVKNRDPKKGVMEFSLTVDRATIAPPAHCAGGPTTQLDTTFGLRFGVKQVLVDATLPWQCRKTELRTP